MQILMLCMFSRFLAHHLQTDICSPKSYLQDANKQLKSTLIVEACQVVDALGPDVRLHLVERFVALELKEYRRIFRTNDEAGQLDNLSRRLAWFRRLLQTHEIEQGRVFPSEWRVGWYLLAKFTEITRYILPFGCRFYSQPSFFFVFAGMT